MVKTPTTRHSKRHRDPVTIELEPGQVSRVEKAAADPEGSSAPEVPIADDAASAPAETAALPDAPKSDTPRPDSPYGAFDYNFDKEEPVQSKPTEAEASSNESATSNGSVQPERGRGGVSGIAAGLAGGALALLVAGGLQYAGVLGSPSAGTGDAPAVAALQTEISGLKSEIAALRTNEAGSDQTMRVDQLAKTLDELKSNVAALPTTDGQGAGDTAALTALDQKLQGLETAVAALGQGGGASAELAALGERIAGLDALVKSAGQESAANQERLAAIEQSVSSLVAKVDAQASQPKIALAIAAAALKSAVERGAPFTAELETFAAIAPNAPELATLRSYAEMGMPTRADITAEMDATANAMVAAAKPAAENAGFFGRLLASAESLVKVRPIGAVEGAGVPETVARMEVAVNQGDYAKALAEFDTLPEAAKAAGSAFAAEIKARLETEKLVDQLVAGAMKA